MEHDRMLSLMRRNYSRAADAASEHGWEIEHQIDKGAEPYLEIIVTRGTERIRIWYRNAKLTEAPVYTFAGIDTKLRNLSAMLQQMAEKPDPNAVRRRAQRATQRGASAMQLVEIIRDLPWDPEEMEDRELLKALYGRTIIWENRISGKPEDDNIRTGVNYDKSKYHISYSASGRRIINFHGAFGFRSVGVGALLRVS